jgi:hypothetical protein
MPKRYRKIQLPVILAMILVCAVGAAAAIAVERTHDPDYWMSVAAVVIPVLVAAGGKIWRAGNSPSAAYLGERLAKLRESVLGEWDAQVKLRIIAYPLQVPFNGVTEVTCRITERDGKEGEATVPVVDSWAAILGGPHRRHPELKGTYDSIADVFTRGLPSRLIVLGEAGAGKSILAQALTVKLLQPGAPEGHGEPSAPQAEATPVFLQLATWDPAVPLNEWAALQMARTYTFLGEQIEVRNGNRQTLADTLIEQGKVLMVLDGLDEVSAENRLAAFEKLSKAALGGQAMVITCRTREYAQVVHDAKHPMPKTPVIRLFPLPLRDVKTYLTDAGPRFRGLLARVRAKPGGAIAKALSSPLALYLVTSVYRDIDTDPSELSGFDDERAILKHLLNGLIPAVYSTEAGDEFPGREEAEVTAAQRRLVKIAQYLSRNPELKSNIDWWRLPRQVPGWFIGGLIGSLVGCLLGAAVGLAASIRFSQHAGVPFGILFGLITGVLSGVTSARMQDHPRAMDPHFHWDYWRFVSCVTVGAAVGLTAGWADARHGGLIAGLVSAAVVGPACAAPCQRVFGWMPGITAGLAAAIAVGLASGLSKGIGDPALAGLGAGVVFAMAGWVFVGLFQPSKDRLAVNPRLLLDRDRVGCLVVAVTAGVAFGVVFGVALGPLIGVVAFVALTVTVALTVSMWAAFNVSRVWLACAGMLPMRVMTFLHEAYYRGVLRQVGGSYQFRHAELQEALLDSARAAIVAEPGTADRGELQAAAREGSAP